MLGLVVKKEKKTWQKWTKLAKNGSVKRSRLGWNRILGYAWNAAKKIRKKANTRSNEVHSNHLAKRRVYSFWKENGRSRVEAKCSVVGLSLSILSGPRRSRFSSKWWLGIEAGAGAGRSFWCLTLRPGTGAHVVQLRFPQSNAFRPTTPATLVFVT